MADIRSFFGGGGPRKPTPKAEPAKTEIRTSPYFPATPEDEDTLVIKKKQKKPEPREALILSSAEKKKRKKIIDTEEEEQDDEDVFETKPTGAQKKSNQTTTVPPKKAQTTPAPTPPPEKPPPPAITPMDAHTFFGTNEAKPLTTRPKKRASQQELDDASLALAIQLQDREDRWAKKSVSTTTTTSKPVVTSPYFDATTTTTPTKKAPEDELKPPVKNEEKPRRQSPRTSPGNKKSPGVKKSESPKVEPTVSSSSSSSTVKPEPKPSSSSSASSSSSSSASSSKPPQPKPETKVPPPKQETRPPSSTPDPVPTPAPRPPVTSPAAKRASGFAAYKHRGGPPMAGQVEYPEGKPYCLAGLTFVMTGVLDSLDAEGFKELIQKYGGRATGDVSGKTSYLVRGTEPGEKKTATANEKKIPIIDEAGLLELIRTLPENVPGGLKPSKAKRAKKGTENLSPQKTEPTTKRELDFSQRATPMAISNDNNNSQQQYRANNFAANPTTSYNNNYNNNSSSSSQNTYIRSNNNNFAEVESKTTQVIKPQDTSGMLWVDKYRPSDPSQIIGNQENVNRISIFLRTWQQQFLEKKNPGTKRSIIISGPPGTGKTSGTTAIAKSLGYQVIEFNASDLRNQAAIEEQISELSSNRSMTEFYRQDRGQTSKLSKTCLIMDEVDGMSGSDRGGIAKLIQIIKKSKIPIICICNDGKDRKLQSLKNYCLDITWRRPTARSIAEKLVKIAQREGLMIDIPSIERMCEMSHADIRQVLHLIQLWAKNDTKVSYDEAKNRMAKAEKDFDLGPFDVCNKFFQVPIGMGPRKENWLDERIDAYFVDADLLPLMVQQNYLSCKPAIGRHGEMKALPGKEPPKIDVLGMEAFSLAADYISWGDQMSNKLRTENDWSLAPAVGVLSTVAPGATVSGGMSGGIMGFPAWLGKNSTTNKNMRLIREISTVMSMDCPCSSRDMGLYYLPLVRYKLLAPMLLRGADGIDDVLQVMTEYALTREDWSDIVELGEGFSDGLHQSLIDSKIKATFTRRFNGEPILAKVTRPSDKNFKPTKIKGDDFRGDDLDEEEDAEEEEDSIEKDKAIKVIKPAATKGRGKAKEESKTKQEGKTAKKKPAKEPKPRISKKK